MKPRWFKVVGNHAVNGVQPGMKFEAVIEDDHPWVVGGHVAVTRPSKLEVTEVKVYPPGTSLADAITAAAEEEFPDGGE